MSEAAASYGNSTAERLERAQARLEDVQSRIDDHGEDSVERGAEAYRNAEKLLEHYVDRATGTGRETFAAYVNLEGQFSTLVENLPEDLVHRDAFEAAWEAIDKRRLNEDDFERAREALEPAATYVDLLEDREAARDDRREARTAATDRLAELKAAIETHERLLDLADVDLDAPVERVREPIDRFNEHVRESFDEYLHDTPAREVFELLERSRVYPLVPFERPPDDLAAYVETNDAGEYPIPDLLEYAEYSPSKLEHYVDDANELKRNVATRQTYLRRLDAEALTVGWPPPRASELRYRLRERRPFVERVGDEECVLALRAVAAATREDEYDRLRRIAVAQDRLSERERRLIAQDRVEAELEGLRAERERLEEALDASAR